jgi:H+/Cl- antiporter ClcA
MAFLNGVSLPDAMRPMVILVKSFSCTMGVTSGMAAGGEGPMIHIGALIGSELSTGRSRWRWLNDLVLPVFRPFRNSKDHRDFTTAGTAAGVTSVFGSPLGGLLFVFEELASFMPPKVAWMTFCACIVCFLTSQVGATYFDNWTPAKIPRFDVNAFTVNEVSTVLFNQNVSPFGQVPFSVLSIAPAVAVGVFLGALAGVFIRAHLFIMRRWRAPIVNKSTRRKMLEPVATAFLYCTLCYVLSATMPCSEIPPFMVNTTDAGLKQLKLHTSLCVENRGHFDEPTHFSMMGTLALTGSYNTIRVCLSRNTGHYFSDPVAVGVYFVLYTVVACFTLGQFFASGVVIPTLVIGSTGARFLTGQIASPWGDPGVLALVGIGAYFSGLSRLTFSLVVILAEISNDLQNLIVVMIGLMSARYVADKIAHSLYHEQLQMRGVPFLDFDTQVHKLDCFCMRDIMTPAPEALPIVTDVGTLRVVAVSKHHAFPVVRHTVADDELRQREVETGSVRVLSGSVHALGSAARAASVSAGGAQDGVPQQLAEGEEYTFLGLISRDLISLLLWHFDLAEASAPGEEAQMPSYRDLEEIREQQHFFEGVPPPPQNMAGANASVRNARLIDLTPFIDTSAPFVQQGMAISRGYNLYRSMSLRHLCVVDSQNQLTGLVTRRNLLGHFMNERLKDKMSAVSMMVRANK